MPGSADRDSELFAGALGGAGGAGGAGESGQAGGAGGPELDERLRRELAVVDLLVAAGQRVGPDEAARNRMRERILAGLAEQLPNATETSNSPTRNGGHAENAVVTPIGSGAGARRRSAVAGVQGRLLVAAAAALCLLVTLSGMSLVLARDALPGDALYGVKRSAESAELGLTFGGEPRGFKHLQFATARVDEIEALAARAEGAGSAADAASYLTALQAFDTDAAAGSRLLMETATTGAGGELATLREWAEQQRQRLDQARAAMPVRAAGRASGTIVLLNRVVERVSALQVRLACVAVTSGARDDVGLLPADGPCVPARRGTGQPNPEPPGVAPTTAGSGAPQPGLVFPATPGGEQPGGLLPLDPGTLGPETGGTGTGGGTGSAATGSAVPGTTSPGQPTTPSPTAITVPLPLPVTSIPPLLPGLAGVRVG